MGRILLAYRNVLPSPIFIVKHSNKWLSFALRRDFRPFECKYSLTTR